MSTELLDSPIAFHRAFVRLGAGITGALMLSQAVYWSKRTKDADGWFYKTQTEWEDETGLSRSEQEGARRKLKNLGILLEDRKGVPCKTYYRIDAEKLDALLANSSEKPKASSLQKSCKQGCGNPANKDAENPQSSVQESCKQDCGKPASKAAENLQTITETTQRLPKDYDRDLPFDPPSDPNASGPPKKPPANRKTKLPDDFEPTQERVNAALSYWNRCGRTDLNPLDEFEKFIAHHEANGSRMANWDAAWRKWYCNAVTFNRPMGGPPQPPNDRRAQKQNVRNAMRNIHDTSW